MYSKNNNRHYPEYLHEEYSPNHQIFISIHHSIRFFLPYYRFIHLLLALAMKWWGWSEISIWTDENIFARKGECADYAYIPSNLIKLIWYPYKKLWYYTDIDYCMMSRMGDSTLAENSYDGVVASWKNITQNRTPVHIITWVNRSREKPTKFHLTIEQRI